MPDEKSITPRSLNETTCFEYQEKSQCPQLLLGYMDAVSDVVFDLRLIIEKSKNFKTLKAELTQFVNERQNLSEFLGDKWDDNSGSFINPNPS